MTKYDQILKRLQHVGRFKIMPEAEQVQVATNLTMLITSGQVKPDRWFSADLMAGICKIDVRIAFKHLIKGHHGGLLFFQYRNNVPVFQIVG